MATPGRQENPRLEDSPIEQRLRENPWSFEFFQAVHLLHRIRSEKQPVGRFSQPADESVRFRVTNSLAFPASQIQELAWEESAQPEMKVNFMGLTGPLGVLPYAYTELILQRLRDKDEALEAFLDIFNHRIISFFYRAWEKYRFPVSYGMGAADLFTHHLLDLIGLGTQGFENREGIDEQALLHFVGLFAMQARSATALEQILTSYFDVPAEVVQFAGVWYPIDKKTQCCMDDQTTESVQLGCGAIVGDELWTEQSRIRIKLGPMRLERYQDFLPDGSAFAPLKAIVRFFTNDELDCDLQLILQREEAPNCQIGDDEETPQLGWTTWLKSVPLSRDPEDTILELQAGGRYGT